MDLSPGSSTLPRMLRAGRTTTWESVGILDPSYGRNTPPVQIRDFWSLEKTGCGPRPPSGHRLGLGGRLAQDVGGNFLQGDAELEPGGLAAASPAGDLPMGAHELQIGMGGEIEQQWSLFAIKFLGKLGD